MEIASPLDSGNEGFSLPQKERRCFCGCPFSKRAELLLFRMGLDLVFKQDLPGRRRPERSFFKVIVKSSRGGDFRKNEVELGTPSLPDANNGRVRWKESSLK
ncbi:hypothetical protein NDU88_001167 [Pleurodeles waltl]|uniref:Uncharacterized protein n=1 Tax=Pleurodeles waltl TaxID=8319 RepID=A0AAV7U8J6_PLEWA|nr:hypothetical protein NDU88_001167 [Pleurodeles waltl]